MRKMAKPALVSALKRAAGEVYGSGGYVRRMQSLGERELPNRKIKKGVTHTTGTYFIMDVDAKVKDLINIEDEYNRDKDIIQHYVLSREKKDEPFVCAETLDAEMLPPAERPSVQDLVKQGRAPPRFRKIFEDNTGLDYYPFHR